MNIFKELNRVNSLKPINPWLKQDGVVSVGWQHNIVVEIKQLNYSDIKSIYLPTFSNGRYVEVHQLPPSEYHDRLCNFNYYFWQQN